jgi:hypothetical protein
MPASFESTRPLPVAFFAGLVACATGASVATGSGYFEPLADAAVAVPATGAGSADAAAPSRGGRLPAESDDAGAGYSGPEEADGSAGGVVWTTAEDAADDRSTDEGPADGGSASKIPGAATPSLGDLLITEVMFDPTGVQPESQWFEIYNVSPSPELLSGVTIQDQNGTVAVIGSDPPVIAPPLSYSVLVRDRAAALSNSLPAAAIVYEYGLGLGSDAGIDLAADDTGELSLWQGSLELADVPYGLWSMDSPGQSVELGRLQLVGADQPWNWCLAQKPWASGSDDGTPGQPNDCN